MPENPPDTGGAAGTKESDFEKGYGRKDEPNKETPLEEPSRNDHMRDDVSSEAFNDELDRFLVEPEQEVSKEL